MPAFFEESLVDFIPVMSGCEVGLGNVPSGVGVGIGIRIGVGVGVADGVGCTLLAGSVPCED